MHGLLIHAELSAAELCATAHGATALRDRPHAKRLLTDNGVQFAHAGPEEESAEDTSTSWRARQQARNGPCYAFGYACEKHGVKHRLIRPYHPRTNGQVERMNRTLKEATVHRYHYASHGDLRGHVQLFLDAYNHARRLKARAGGGGGSHPTSSPAKPGPKNQNGSGAILHTTPWD